MNNASRLREIEKCEYLLEFEDLKPRERRCIEQYRLSLISEKMENKNQYKEANKT